jgi:hypothetical protein
LQNRKKQNNHDDWLFIPDLLFLTVVLPAGNDLDPKRQYPHNTYGRTAFFTMLVKFNTARRLRFPLPMHEQTQRFILLLLFYLTGPVLTLGIIGGIVLRKLPNNARHWEYQLSQKTGLHWKIQSVEYRSPGSIRLHNVEIVDDITLTAVFHAQTADVRLIADPHRESLFPGMADTADKPAAGTTVSKYLAPYFSPFSDPNRFWQIVIPQAFLNLYVPPRVLGNAGQETAADSSPAVQNMLQKLSARAAGLSDRPVQIIIDQMTAVSGYSIKREGEKYNLFRFVRGTFYRTASDIRSNWTFQIKNVSEIGTESLSFILSPQTDSQTVVFQTGKEPIPCDLAAVFCPMFKRFSGGTFRGEFIFTADSKSKRIRLQNVSFADLPLAPFIKRYTPFAVQGTIADMRIFQASFGSGDWSGEFSATGCLQVVNGAIEQPLFHRCVENFRLTVEPGTLLESPMTMIPFTACSIHFRLLPEGMFFWADELWKNAFMYYDAENDRKMEMIVYLPQGNGQIPISYNAVLSVFVPDSVPVVPLTKGMREILPVIPVTER